MCCNVRVYDRPDEVVRAMQLIENVEIFYLQLEGIQAIAESIHQVTCCVHAITPGNRPMGWRHVILVGSDLLNDAWIEELRQICDLQNQTLSSALWQLEIREKSANLNSTSSLILVKEKVYRCWSSNRSLLWMICSKTVGSSMSFGPLLSWKDLSRKMWLRHSPSPFFGLDMQTATIFALLHRSSRIRDVQAGWQPGDYVRIRMRLWQKYHLLSLLLHEGEGKEVDEEVEVTNLLQRDYRSHRMNHRTMVTLDATPFAEFCNAITKRNGVFWILLAVLKMNENDEMMPMELAIKRRVLATSVAVCWDNFAVTSSNFCQRLGWSQQGLCSGSQQSPFCTNCQSDGVAGWRTYCIFLTDPVTDSKRHGPLSFSVKAFLRAKEHSSGLDGSRLHRAHTLQCPRCWSNCYCGGSRVHAVTSRCARSSNLFNYDAVAVGHGACGKQRTPQTQEGFSARQHAARVLLSIRQQKSRSMTGLHVKAQEGQPWNECAESIAAWGKILANERARSSRFSA